MREDILEENNWRRPDLGRRYQVYHLIDAQNERPGVTGHVALCVASGAITALVVSVILNLL
jgi:hypothetical protein